MADRRLPDDEPVLGWTVRLILVAFLAVFIGTAAATSGVVVSGHIWAVVLIALVCAVALVAFGEWSYRLRFASYEQFFRVAIAALAILLLASIALSIALRSPDPVLAVLVLVGMAVPLLLQRPP